MRAIASIGLWKRLLGVDAMSWRASKPWNAARLAFGVALPLTLGWISGHIHYGVYAALGAFSTGIASFQGETVSRIAVMAAALLGMAVSTFVGGTLAAAAPWVLVPVVGLWGYVAGLAVCGGPRAGLAVLQWSITLLIAVGLPLTTEDAASRALFVIAGGLLQAVLIASSWTLSPGLRERNALAASYRELAGYASELAQGQFTHPAPGAFSARSVVEDPNPLLSWPLRLSFIDLLEEAERIRASLTALASHESGLAPDRSDKLRALAGGASAALEQIAAALEGASRQAPDLNAVVGALTVPAQVPWRWAAETLLGEMRAVASLVTRLDAAAAPAAAGGKAATRPERRPLDLAAVIALLRANIGTSTEAGRHALRLAIVASLGEALSQVMGLYQGRWVAMTIFLVLKPDYASTLHRGIQRAAGTALGVLLCALVARVIPPAQGELVVAAALAIALGYAAFNVNFLAFSLFLTVFIVVLLELLGVPAAHTAEARFFNTLFGAALALIAYRVWPTWEGLAAQEKFARLLEGQRDYTEALLREFANPGSVGAARLRIAESAARRARSDAEAAADRLSQEPEHPPLTPEVAHALIATAARLAQVNLALHTLVISEARPLEAPAQTMSANGRLNDLRTSVNTALTRLAYGLRKLEPPETIPALRPLHALLREATPPIHEALLEVTDRLVDVVNTLDAIVRGRLTVQAPPSAAVTV